MRFLRSALALLLGASLYVASAQTLASTHQTTDQWVVPAIAQEPDCPKEGWCGEAAIQMIGMYYGCYFPQKLINKAGKPNNPDLWSNNLPTALDALGFKWNEYHTSGVDDYIRQLKSDLDNSVPVLLGLNVFSHGSGGAHFCIAAKYDDQTLTINTTWAMTPNKFAWSKMKIKEGVTLADTFMGLAVPAPDVLAAHRLRLYAADPNAFFTKKSKLRLVASRLVKSGKYQIRSYDSVKSADENRGAGPLVAEFIATDTEHSQDVEVDHDQPIVFVLTHLRG